MKRAFSSPFFYVGPPLESGPLPTFFYYALSAKESLITDPYDQAVKFLMKLPIRVFSLDLPGHGDLLSSQEAMKLWAEDFIKNKNPIAPIIQKTKDFLALLDQHGLLLEGKNAVGGLSRGAFVACHVAAEIEEFETILGFAPMTTLGYIKEFQEIQHNHLVQSLDLARNVELLMKKVLRFYIGNHDTRVGTDNCFFFIKALCDKAFEHKIRSPQVELFIRPSIGYQGHGTSKDIFEDGALWIANKFGLL